MIDRRIGAAYWLGRPIPPVRRWLHPAHDSHPRGIATDGERFTARATNLRLSAAVWMRATVRLAAANDSPRIVGLLPLAPSCDTCAARSDRRSQDASPGAWFPSAFAGGAAPARDCHVPSDPASTFPASGGPVGVRPIPPRRIAGRPCGFSPDQRALTSRAIW